jgi:hypothetical protein
MKRLKRTVQALFQRRYWSYRWFTYWSWSASKGSGEPYRLMSAASIIYSALQKFTGYYRIIWFSYVSTTVLIYCKWINFRGKKRQSIGKDWHNFTRKSHDAMLGNFFKKKDAVLVHKRLNSTINLKNWGIWLWHIYCVKWIYSIENRSTN